MPASQMESREIIAAINELVGSDRAKAKEFAKELRSGVGPVAQSLINIGKSQAQSDGGAELDRLKQQVQDLTESVEAKDAEIQQLTAKVPDAAQVEESYRKKWEPKLTKAEQRALEAETRATTLAQQVVVDKALARLLARNEQGQAADPEYVHLIAAEKIRKLVTPKPDGNVGVRTLDGDGEYDGETVDQKVDALIKDFRPTIPAAFVLTNADSGAGVRNGGGSVGGTWSQYRKEVEQERKQQQSGPTGAERLRGVTTGTAAAR